MKKSQKISLALGICVLIFLIAESDPVEAGWNDPCCNPGDCGGTCCFCGGAGPGCDLGPPPVEAGICGPGWCGFRDCRAEGYYYGWDASRQYCMRCAGPYPNSCIPSCNCFNYPCIACGNSGIPAYTCNCPGVGDPSTCQKGVPNGPINCFNCPPEIISVREKAQGINLDGGVGLPYEFVIEIRVTDPDGDDPIDITFTATSGGDTKTCTATAHAPYPATVDCDFPTQMGPLQRQLRYAGFDYDWTVEANDHQSENNIDRESGTFTTNAYPDVEYNPVHGATDVSLEPTLTVTVEDEDFATYYGDDSIDVYVYDHWKYVNFIESPFADLLRPFFLDQIIPIGTTRIYDVIYDYNNNGEIDPDSRSLEYGEPLERLCYDTAYSWQSVVTDSLLREYADDRIPGNPPGMPITTYYSFYNMPRVFTTEENEPPTVTVLYPADGDNNVPLDPIVRVLVTDPNNDEMDVNFSLNGVQQGMVGDIASGNEASFLFRNLGEETTNTWSVTVCDTHWEVCSGNVADKECTTTVDSTFETHRLEGLIDEVLPNDYGVYDHTEHYASLHESYWFTFDAIGNEFRNMGALNPLSYDPEGDQINYTWHFGDGSLCTTDETAPLNCRCGTPIAPSIDTELIWCLDHNGDTVIDELDGFWDMNDDGVVDEFDCVCLDSDGDGDLDSDDFGLGVDRYGNPISMNRNGDCIETFGDITDGICEDNDPPLLDENDCTFGALFSGCLDVTGGELDDCPPTPDGVNPPDPRWGVPDGDIDECDYLHDSNLGPEEESYRIAYNNRNKDDWENLRDCGYIGEQLYYTIGESEVLEDRCAVVNHTYNHTKAHVYVVNLTITDELGHSTSEVKDLSVRALACDEPTTELHACCYLLPTYKVDGEEPQQKQPCEAELDRDCWHVYMYHQQTTSDKCDDASVNRAWGCVPEDTASLIHASDAKGAVGVSGCEAITPLLNHAGECKQFGAGCGPYDCGIFTECHYSWTCKYSASQMARLTELCIDASSTYDDTEEYLKACCTSLEADPCVDIDLDCAISGDTTITVNCENAEACDCVQFIADHLGIGGTPGITLDDWAGCHPWRYWNAADNDYCFGDDARKYQTETECENDPVNPYDDDNCDCVYFDTVFTNEKGCSIKEIIDEVSAVSGAGCTFSDSVKSSNWLLEAVVGFLWQLAWRTTGLGMAITLIQILMVVGDIVTFLGSAFICDLQCLVQESDTGDINCVALHYQHSPDNDMACTVGVPDKFTLTIFDYPSGGEITRKDSCISTDIFQQCRLGSSEEDDLNCNFTTQKCTCQDISTEVFNCRNTLTELRDTIYEADIDNPGDMACIGAAKDEDPRDNIPLTDSVCDIGKPWVDPITSVEYTITGYKPLPSTADDPTAYEDCYFRGYGYEYAHGTPCVCDNGLPMTVQNYPYNGQDCMAVQAYRGILICDRNHKKRGTWDASEDQCVSCLRNLEEFTIADINGAYPKGRGVRHDGSEKCEAACGSDPYCDEVSPLDYPRGEDSGQEEPQCSKNMLMVCNKDCEPVVSSVCYSTKYDPNIPDEETDPCYIEINPQCQFRPPGSVCCADDHNSDGDCDDINDVAGLCTDECECFALAQYWNFDLKPGLNLISYPLLPPEEGEEGIYWLGDSNALCYSVPNLRAVETSTQHAPDIFEHNVTTVCGELDPENIIMYPDGAYLLDIAGSYESGFTLWGKVAGGEREVTLYPGWNWFGFTSMISQPVNESIEGVFDLIKFPYIYRASPECELNISDVLS